MQADRLLGPEVSDVDGNSEKRNDTVSVFNGPPPAILKLGSQEEEVKAVGGWLAERVKGGVLPQEIGLFVRSAAERDRAVAAAKEAGIPFKILDEQWKRSVATWPSALCTSPKGWSSAPWP